MAITSKILLKFDGAAVKSGLASIKKQFASLNKEGGAMLGKLAGNTAKFASILGPAAIGVGIAKIGSDAVSAASDVESLTSQFKTLLGSQDAAVKRMSELEEFAASTPFEVSEIASTSKMLQTLGGELLSTGDGLRLVGDAAAMAGQPLSEVGLHVGRLFGALTSGTSAGEATARLQELGLISGVAKRQFEDLAESQEKGESKILGNAEALNVLGQVLKKSKGSMADLANTTEGKFSNLKDSYTQLLVKLGAPINSALKPLIDELIAKLAEMKNGAQSLGEGVSKGITAIRNSFSNGNFFEMIKSGFNAAVSLVGEKILAAFILGADIVRRSVMEGFARSLLGSEKVDAFKRSNQGQSMTWNQASETARNAFGSEDYANNLNRVVDRNQSALPTGFRYAEPGESSIFSDGAGNKVIQLLEGINQKLSPQP